MRSVTKAKAGPATITAYLVTLVTLVTPHLKKFSKVFFHERTVTNVTT